MKFYKISRLILVLALSLLPVGTMFSLDAQEDQNDLAHVFKTGLIRVGVKAHAPPFSESKEGKLVGFDVSIAQAIASYLEVELELVPLASAERIPSLLEKKVDIVIATLTITRSREDQVDFSIPYFQDGQSLLCKKDSKVESYQDLKELKVAAVKGTTSLKNLPLVQPAAIVVDYDSPELAMEALLKGEIDAFSSDMLMLMGIKLNHPQGDQLELRGGRFTVEPYGVAVRPNQSDMRDKINDAIMSMWKSGTWKAMYTKWFGPQSPYAMDNSFEVKVIN